jgi:predicted CXXCH cytochrome family protein
MSRRRRKHQPIAPIAPTAPPAGRRRVALRRQILGAAIVLVAIAAAAFFWRPWDQASPTAASGSEAEPSFVGAEACAACHERETEAWRGSQHARAMQDANEQTVLGDFGDRTFAHAGVTTTFYKRDGRFHVRTEGPDGRFADYEVKYTFGVAPLQQYLLELPGGRLQALTIAWSTREQRWFHLYPDQKIPAGDELHWTGRQQNWNFMCADCHSTDVRKNYDARSDTFASKWAEISVGCESCHGPGSRHVAWAGSKDADPRKGLTVALDERRRVAWAIDSKTGNAERSRPRDTEREIEVCAQCHARRLQIAEGYRAGRPFLDHYRPALLTAPLYHVDGQQREEVYGWGSFLQSRMYRRGVTCSDCHDPHAQSLRAPGNAVCAQCHAAARYDAAAHHFHRPGTQAGECASCHMPTATYMVVDPRHDHSLRAPRPDLSVALGVPNPCNSCHREAGAKWAAEAVRKWYGRDARSFQAFARTFRDAELGKPRSGAALAALAADTSQPPIARASALARLEERPDPVAARAALAGARDADPLMRLAAAGLADALRVRERVAVAGPLLNDAFRAVRIEAARALAGVPEGELTSEQRAAWRRAVDEYATSQRYNADRPEARTNLGTFYARLGRFDEAQAEFRAAVALDKRFAPAYVNAADAYREQAREDDALRVLREGLAAAPENAALHHALGLALVRRKEPAAALRSLERAARLAPDQPRYAYVYAVALNSLGRAAEALGTLERAAARWPADRDILFALAAMQRDAGRRDAARKTAEALVAAHPDDPEARALAAEHK